MNTSTRWIIAIIVLAIIAVGISWIIKGSSTPAASTATTTAATYGMSEYSDTAFGFSFWYPSALAVIASTTIDDTSFPGGVAVEELQVGQPGGVNIAVVSAPEGSITDEPSNHASPIGQTKYFYNAASSTWMVAYPDSAGEGSAIATTTADIASTTIGGLPMLPSGLRFDATIIPLSLTQFLVINDGGGSSFTQELAATVAPLGATVSPAAQAAALSAEASAAANQ